MKKFYLLMFLLVFVTSYSQEDVIFGNENPTDQKLPETDQRNFFPDNSEFTSLEVSFNPGNVFGSSTGDMFGLINGNIKYRHFSSRTNAFRMGINVSFLSEKVITQNEDEDTDDDLELSDKYTSYGIGIMLGSEKHYGSSKRVSPYTGWQIGFSYVTSKYISEYQDGDNVESRVYTNYDLPPGLPQGKWGVSIGFISGIDYYFVKHFYIGVELGIGLEYNKFLTGSFEDTGDSDMNDEHKGGYQIVLSPQMTTGNLRLGWSF